MQRLSASEKETLAGPLAVGCLLGAIVAIASWGFDGEYRHLESWPLALNALVAFATSVLLVVVPLGILPVVVRRLRRPTDSRIDQPRP